MLSNLLLFLLFLPILLPLVCKLFLKSTLNWQEMVIQAVLPLLAVGVLYAMAMGGKTLDTEIWNGQVTSKKQVRVSCSHSYQCNCYNSCSGSGKNRTCTRVCQTCYEHSNDWDWRVYSTAGNFEIPRVDRRGRDEPPRWSSVEIGEPASREHWFENYVKAVPESLFNDAELADNFEALPPVPTYPEVYDFYRIQRAIPVGVNVPELDKWNHNLSMELRTLGPERQANIIVLFVNTPDARYRYKVEANWLGGKKNDVVVFLGTEDGKTLLWADVMTWARNMGNSTFHVQLRDALLAQEQLDSRATVDTIAEHVDRLYDRPEMKDFAYLKKAITPPMWALVLIVLITLSISLGLAYYFHRNDVRFIR